MKNFYLLILTVVFALSVNATTHTINVSNFQFSPASVPNVACGDTIKWQWINGSHTTTSTTIPAGAVSWNSNINSSTSTYMYVPTIPGTYNYHCIPHLFTGSFVVGCASPAVVFQNDYGTTDSLSDASGACVQQTADGGYITAGYISNYGAGMDDIYLVKTNASGGNVWTKTYGGSLGDDANYVVQTTDGGYAIAGVTLSFGGENILLIKTNSTGAVTWSKIYGSGDSLSDASASSFKQTNDGGYILTGYVSNYGAGADDYYLVKTDSSGNIQWTKTYGGINNDDASSVSQTSDGGYIIAGTSSSFSDTLGDIYVVKTNSIGDTLWTKSYGSSLNDAVDMGKSVQQTTDHGFIIAGVTISSSSGEFARLMKIDSSGTMQWTKLYGTGNSSSDASFSSVQQTADGGYIATGYTSNFGAGQDDYFLIKTNSTGDTSWTRTYGSDNVDDANFVKQTSDGGYIVGGVTLGFAAGGEHLYLVKTDSSGSSTCSGYRTQTVVDASITTNAYFTNTQISSGGVANNAALSASSGGSSTNVCAITGINEFGKSELIVKIFPNPFSENAIIEIHNSKFANHNLEFMLYDVLSNQVAKIKVQEGQQFTIKRENLPDGIYFYNIVNSSEILNRGKIIIAR